MGLKKTPKETSKSKSGFVKGVSKTSKKVNDEELIEQKLKGDALLLELNVKTAFEEGDLKTGEKMCKELAKSPHIFGKLSIDTLAKVWWFCRANEYSNIYLSVSLMITNTLKRDGKSDDEIEAYKKDISAKGLKNTCKNPAYLGYLIYANKKHNSKE